MVYAPDHFQQAVRRTAPPHRYRTRRERLSFQVAVVLVLVLAGLVVFSLTNHQRHNGNGCIDFNYTTMIGGAEMHRCGAQARTLCATPPTGKSIDTDFQTELYAACRRGGFATGRAHS